MTPKAKLQTEATGRFLGEPMVGAHDGGRTIATALERCSTQLRIVTGH
jgi:hypothetical protein